MATTADGGTPEPTIEQALGRAGGSRRSDDLDLLAHHENPRVRAVVAANPACPPATLALLLRDPNRRVQAQALRNPSTPTTALVETPPPAGRSHEVANALSNRELSCEELDELVRSPAPELRRVAVHSRSLLPHQITALAKHPEHLAELARNHHLTRPAFRSVRRTGEAAALEALGGSDLLSARQRASLLLWHNPAAIEPALRALAANPQTPKWGLARLRLSRSWRIRVELVRRSAVSRRILRWWVRRGPDALDAAIARHPDTPHSALRILAAKSPTHRLALTENPALPSHMAATLADDPDIWVRGAGLGNPNLPSSEVERHAADPGLLPWQLRRLANNPSCPQPVRDQALTWLALGGAGPGDPLFEPFDGPNARRQPFGDVEALKRHRHPQAPVAHFRAMALLEAGTCETNTLKRHAQHPSPEVRLAAARYQNASILMDLARDSDHGVRSRARSTLDEMWKHPRPAPLTKTRDKVIFAALGGVMLTVLAVGALADQREPSIEETLRDFREITDLVGGDPVNSIAVEAMDGFPTKALVTLAVVRPVRVTIIGPTLCRTSEASLDAGLRSILIEFCDEPKNITVVVADDDTSKTFTLPPPASMVE
jgi:hypothetical protein